MRASQRSCSINSAALERFRDVLVPWRERYICVYTRVPIRIPEDDLFAGVPGDSAP